MTVSSTALPSGLRYLVAGGGGFIGGHLSRALLERGARSVRCVDVKPLEEWYQVHPDTERMQLDLSLLNDCRRATEGVDVVINLAADMGGMGFIEANKALCMLSVLINTHLLEASREAGVQRFLFSSSACVYNGSKQKRPDVTALSESDAYPADPEDGYGWEKLFSERMCRHFEEDFGLETRVVRYHNVYGPHGTWDGGREKAPAAICRKVAQAVRTGRHEIEIWGDGEQTRSFLYISDCVEGTLRVLNGHVNAPINVGSSELVSINDLVATVERIAGVTLERHYRLDAPLGVRGRNSDNTIIERELGWLPSVSLADGLRPTYEWIARQMAQL